MRIFLLALIVLAFIPGSLFCQITPAENDTLNYVLVGFSFPKVKKENNYRIQIALGTYNDVRSFEQNIAKSVEVSGNKAIVRLPYFGKHYTWRVMPSTILYRQKAIPFYHFNVGTIPDVDTAFFRLRIMQSAKKYQDAYVFLDGNRAMYDMEGYPVWYLPDMAGIVKANSQVRDLKLSCSNTITFIMDGRALEVDYRGRILWEGPNGRKMSKDSLEGYHHEMTRLCNGHYMVLGVEPVAKPKIHRDSTGRLTRADSMRRRPNRGFRQRYGTVMEYDENGVLVWEWKSGSYFDQADMSLYRKTNGMPEFDVHENSFFFDEKNKALYVSFRNIGTVIKISYPSGKVLKVYGKLENSTDSMERHMFCGQHSCKISESGNLFVFNNGCGLTAIPSLVVMKEPFSENDSLQKIWEFSCPVEAIPPDTMPKTNAALLNRRYSFTAGGNIIELPDNSMFVCTNVPHDILFIVSPDKEILWSAASEKWRAEKKQWMPNSHYRASIFTDPKQLETLIWNSSQ